MADPNFEKQVQQKMEELTFSPSDAVWEKVDAEINKERKRRIPLFWLFFFAGLTVAGGIYLISTNKKGNSIVSTTSNPKNQSAEIKKEETQKSVVNPDIKLGSSAIKKEISNKNFSTEKNIENKINSIPATKHKIVNNNGNEISFVKTYPENNIKKQKSPRQKDNKNLTAKNDEKNNKVAGNNNKLHSSIIEKNIDVTDNNKNIDAENDFTSSKAIDSTAIAKQENKKTDSAKNAEPVAVTEKPAANDSVKAKPIVKNKEKIKQNPRWKFGITASAGLSDVKQNLFKSAYVYNQNSYLAASNSPGTTPGNTYTSSAINPGFSFSAGLFAKKLLSQRISFSAGLNYHYYSTEIKIGYYSANAFYVYTPGLNAIPISSYYTSGSSNPYTNHYHFLELPLMMDFQLNKNKKLPVYWEAGFAVSYLMNTDALHFDHVTGVYYKKNDLFNKMQASAATALMFGFPFHKNILEIGPQINYGFSHLLNKSTGNTEHLFFAGLKVSTTFGKK